MESNGAMFRYSRGGGNLTCIETPAFAGVTCSQKTASGDSWFFCGRMVPLSYMSIESELEKQVAEREPSRESREGFEMDAQGEAAAAMERADYIVKDVKSTKQQMKNIVMNMHAVKQQIQQLRQQLQLVHSDDDSSLAQDQARVDELKEKIAGYQKEIEAMRDDLIREQKEELLTNGFVGDVMAEAERLVDKMIGDVTSE